MASWARLFWERLSTAASGPAAKKEAVAAQKSLVNNKAVILGSEGQLAPHQKTLATHTNSGTITLTPLQRNLLAGSMAGFVEVLTMYPLDVVKTRTQLSHSRGGDGVLRTLCAVVSEGVMYRGIATPMSCDPAKRALKFAAFEFFSQQLSQQQAPLVLTPHTKAFAAGAMTGLTEALFEAPFENTKIRMQSPHFVGFYKNSFHCARETLAVEGPGALFRGLAPHAMRNAIWNGCFFGTNAVLGARVADFNKRHFDGGEVSTSVRLSQKFLCGIIAGGSGGILNTPLDVVKSRVQALQTGFITPSGEKFSVRSPYANGTFHALRTIAHEEGVGALFRGLQPRLLRLGIGGGIMTVVFEAFTQILGRFDRRY